MQTVRLLQTVVLMLVIALAASCAASKEYTAKLFAPRIAPESTLDSSGVALKFLNMDTAEEDKSNWVSTDIIMGRDSSNSTTALDNFSKTFPASPVKKDSIAAPKEKEVNDNRSVPILTEVKPPVEKTEKTDAPVAKSYDNGDVRSKRTRAEK
jgi:hypothetical protein